MVKGCETHGLHVLIVAIGAKIMPKPQREGGELQSAIPTAGVRHGCVSVITSCIRHTKSSYLFYYR